MINPTPHIYTRSYVITRPQALFLHLLGSIRPLDAATKPTYLKKCFTKADMLLLSLISSSLDIMIVLVIMIIITLCALESKVYEVAIIN